MANVNAKDLREKTDQELLDQLALEKKNLFDATLRGSSGEAVKPHEKKASRRLIARIETVLRERGLRKQLDEKIKTLGPKAEGATGVAAKMAARDPRPHLGRVRVRVRASERSAPNRAAVRLAEAKRLKACLDREDPGETK